MSFGIGAMLHVLSGGNKNDPAKYVGKTITAVAGDGDVLSLTLDKELTIQISDQGQSCCENRYMRTDDNLQDLVGKKLVGIEVNEARSGDVDGDDSGYDDAHEVVFLDIKTDQLVVSFSFHNEHNGYYGGFGLDIREV